MKKVAIVTGIHFAGKSKTINKFLKKRLGMTERQRKFILNDKDGYILSQSLEESGKAVDDVIKNYSGYYDLLVCAARPADEKGSKLNELSRKLGRKGFDVKVFQVYPEQEASFYKQTAEKILKHLES